ncbi:MAG TPA: AAA family ATPase [Flavihumibacter sp.]|nr:AAA family ATPase [Flavihumibacter sp.]HPZ87151.1 AAA family ATPase [Flavihumibacter sp.]HQD08575.1 AAA family ATPase [Flavihumibacter sp.]
MNSIDTQNNIDLNHLFADDYISARILFLHRFRALPDLRFINQVGKDKAAEALEKSFAPVIDRVLRRNWYCRDKKTFQSDVIIVLMKEPVIVEFDRNYCNIYFDKAAEPLATAIAALVLLHRQKERRLPREINIILNGGSGFYLQAMPIKPVKLDIDLYYPDDFQAVNQVIQQRLRQKNDKGVVLLHGLPGTGKTTYLRYLIARIKKRVLFLSTNMAANLLDPSFIELLVDYPNSVLVIEDAENVIVDRRQDSSSAVSALLNIADGLLADFLNVQLICTFNSALTRIDPALQRQGRLIARYDFGKLGVDKAQRLSDHLKLNKKIVRPQTLAEIMHVAAAGTEQQHQPVLGFRRQEMLNN